MYRKQVTMIDDLMDLESQSPQQSYINNQQQQGIPMDPDMTFTNKFIRTSSNGNGMGKLDEVNQQMMPYQPKQPIIQKQEIIEPQQQLEYKPYYQHRLHCVDVVNHIKDCPVCQKLFNNNEKNIYIMVIVILVIIIALLVKKLIEK